MQPGGYPKSLGALYQWVSSSHVPTIGRNSGDRYMVLALPRPQDFLGPSNNVELPQQMTSDWIDQHAEYTFNFLGRKDRLDPNDATLAVGRESQQLAHGGMLYVVFADGHLENRTIADAEQLVR
jgi:prepilin-type processing-associated H-X9-DG protein